MFTLPLNREDIEKIIPHRGPAILIDEIIELEPGHKATAKTTFPRSSPIFEGHFPNNPILPGHILVEALAQTGAVCVSTAPAFEGKLLIFRSIKDCEFKRPVRPGDEITLKVEIERIIKPRGSGTGEARVRNRVACKAIISFVAVKPRRVPADQK